ncbi:hypothetical protein TI39_contig516g00002 [Zymoseptoria brevis]|uniref:Uncharacterized protein n=1 Tax=Zymoseptoria brevis TaxID=1047168 RepID=A0A0F4GM59_9PEZI|nr:hypothetical protein TI39_contig516g00002 [Zymoseptoria brevis]
MTDLSSDRNDGAVPRADSPLSSSDEAVETEIVATPALSAEGETTMPLADSPSVPIDGMLEGEMVVEQSPFLRIPAELRIPIYKLLVLPIPFTIIECPSEDCGNEWSFLASTCKPASSQIRTYNCEDCKIRHRFRKLDVHLQILRTSRHVYHEASGVLYEHVQVMAGSTWAKIPKYPSAHLAPHIRHLCWTVPCEDTRLIGMITSARDHLPNFPNLQTVRLHMDVDLVQDLTSTRLDNTTRDLLTRFGDQVEFFVDVHIVKAWSDDPSGWHGFNCWSEQMISRAGREERGKELDAQVVEMKLQLVTDLSEAFKRKGKVLKVREEGVLEVDAAETQQDGMMKPKIAENQQDGSIAAKVAEDQQEG